MSPHEGEGVTTMGTWGEGQVNKDIPKTLNFFNKNLLSVTHTLFTFKMYRV